MNRLLYHFYLLNLKLLKQFHKVLGRKGKAAREKELSSVEDDIEKLRRLLG